MTQHVLEASCLGLTLQLCVDEGTSCQDMCMTTAGHTWANFTCMASFCAHEHGGMNGASRVGPVVQLMKSKPCPNLSALAMHPFVAYPLSERHMWTN